MKLPGVIRECEHPGKPHSHGRAGYLRDGCRCTACRAGCAAYAAHRRKLKALGHGPAIVPVTGARRRLQALMLLGWTADQLGREIGMTRWAVHGIIEDNRSIRRAKHDAVKAVYDRLWQTRAEKSQGARYVSRMASRRGWASAMAWDDDTIDDPTAEPFGVPPARRQCPTCDAAPMQRCVNLSRGARRKPRDSFHPDRLGTMEEAA